MRSVVPPASRCRVDFAVSREKGQRGGSGNDEARKFVLMHEVFQVEFNFCARLGVSYGFFPKGKNHSLAVTDKETSRSISSHEAIGTTQR